MDIYLCAEKHDAIFLMGKASDIISVPAGIDKDKKMKIRDSVGTVAMAVYCGHSVNLGGAAICLGDFDGVHAGHMRLFELAKKHGKWGVLLLNRSDVPEKLTTLAERLEILENLGADFAVIAEFTEAFAGQTPREFAHLLVDAMNVGTVVVGYDYRFGAKASGDAQLLKSLLNCKAEVIAADAVSAYGEPIKSTKIRVLIKQGDLKCAETLMTRPYRVRAEIVRGKQNGRKLGFPTANFDIAEDKLLPPDGVYFGKVDGQNAVINIGKNPTFNAKKRTFEAHIPHFDGDLYGKTLTVELICKIRGEKCFENLEELKRQIENDISAMRKKTEEYYG